jgi:hypothetical protein
VGTIYEDIDAAAAAIAGELTLHGYALDFSMESLAEVDRFFDENSALDPDDPDAASDSLLAARLGQWMFGLGAYSGETLRRTIGGRWRWQGRDDDKAASTDTELVLVDNSIVWPFQRAWKRLMNGPDDSVAAWGREMADAVVPEEPSP